jgi:precorrin-6B methylase 2
MTGGKNNMKKIKELLGYKILREIYHWFLGIFLAPFHKLGDRIRYVIKEHTYEKRLGICTVYTPLENSPVLRTPTMFRDGEIPMPTPYNIIEKMLDQLQFSKNDVFVDLGCGKGRVIFSVAEKKLKKIIGVEVRKDLFDIAMENLRNLKLKNTPVEIVNADAATFNMQEGTIFFMFNPFGIKTQEKVMKNIKNSLKTNPRKVRIVSYYGPNLNNIKNCDWLSQGEKMLDINLCIWHSK